MEEDSLVRGLERLWTADEENPKLKTAVKDAIQLTLNKITAQLRTGEIQIPVLSLNITEQISSLQETHKRDYEQQIREHRLTEALKMKQELEEKLSYVAEAIDLLNTQPELDLSKPGKGVTKLTRKQLADIEEEKRRQCLDFAKKHMDAQRERKRKRQLQVQHMADSLQDRIEKDRQHRQELEQKLAEDKEKRLHMLQQQAQVRQEQLLLAKQRTEKPRPKVPDKPSILMPELENRKSELAKKRIITQEEITDHMKRYQEKLRQDRERRQRDISEKRLEEAVQEVTHTKHYHSVVEEDKRSKELQEQQVIEKRLRVEKQKKYAELVKEMYVPAVDQTKAEEAAGWTAPKPLKPQRDSMSGDRVRNDSALLQRGMSSAMSEGELATKPPLPRIKPKPKPEEVVKAKPVDYLEVQKKARTEKMQLALERFQSSKVDWEKELRDSSLDETEKLAKVRSKVREMEQEVRLKEAVLNRVPATNAKGLDAEASVNDMIIASIKAKLSLLQS